MIDAGAILTLLAVALQSVGKVLYGTFLQGVATPWFVLVSMSVTAAVFLVSVRLRLPRAGRGLLVLTNVWTAISFISMFFALKHLPPAMFASMEIGMSVLTAITITSVAQTQWPARLRVLACAGILAGCVLLAWVELGESASAAADPWLWIAMAAALITGISSTLTAMACRNLALQGWSSRAVLAHRFYLTILVAAAWLALDWQAISEPAPGTFGIIALVGVAGVLLPLLVLQLALRRAEALTVMICMAAQPLLSFLISLPSPAYAWNTFTLLGVIAVTLCVGLDIATQRARLRPALAAAPAACSPPPGSGAAPVAAAGACR